jgi:putative transposase
MKTKRYSTEQIIGILKEEDAGMPVKDLCRKYGFTRSGYVGCPNPSSQYLRK